MNIVDKYNHYMQNIISRDGIYLITEISSAGRELKEVYPRLFLYPVNTYVKIVGSHACALNTCPKFSVCTKMESKTAIKEISGIMSQISSACYYKLKPILKTDKKYLKYMNDMAEELLPF